jgi:Cdc6-like AAA superfamily ATPase
MVVGNHHKEVLGRLSPLKYDSTQNDNYRQRHAGSLNWFLQRPEYQKWLTERGSTLFCPGIPGAGKTVLAATVIQDLRDRTSTATESTGIAWIYFNFKERPEQTAINVIGSICAQLAQSQPDLIEEVNLHRKSGNLQNFITEKNFLQLLAKSVGKYARSYLVIDALDEFNADDTAWMSLLDAIRKFAPQLNILVTSGPHVRFDCRFAQTLRIDIVAQKMDLLDYVRASLEHPVLHRHLATDEKLKTSIEEAIVHKSQGM